jgi:hypothetical protein
VLVGLTVDQQEVKTELLGVLAVEVAGILDLMPLEVLEIRRQLLQHKEILAVE